ncbi:hypothetical protein SOVF_135270 [Spinacia oleracea]|nr:hypothetical protein SOVF_135270 [Spinacia oleracea]
MNNTIIADPKNLEHILRARFDNYPKGKPMSAILGDLLGQGIFIVDGEHWRFQRKLASLELGAVSVRAYAYEVLNNVVEERLVPDLLTSSGEAVDFQDVLKKFSFVNICRFSFGVDPEGLDGLAGAFDIASSVSSERALCPSQLVWRAKRLLNLGSERRLKAAISKVNILAENIIRERKKKGFNNKSDLLSRFMGSVSDDKYLRDIVVSFLLAGRDTVASGLTIFFYLMARNPNVEARILEESDRVLGQRLSSCNTAIPTMEELRKMEYLQAVMYETLRLYPPVQMDSKFAKNDDVLPDGTHVKKGTRVAYHPYAMGRMETIWGPDCLEFKPERWLNDEGVFVPVSPYKYPVFQAGVRPCLGKDMGLLAMKVVAHTLVRRFHIRLVDPSWSPHFVPGLTATLKDGMPVVVTER